MREQAHAHLMNCKLPFKLIMESTQILLDGDIEFEMLDTKVKQSRRARRVSISITMLNIMKR